MTAVKMICAISARPFLAMHLDLTTKGILVFGLTLRVILILPIRAKAPTKTTLLALAGELSATERRPGGTCPRTSACVRPMVLHRAVLSKTGLSLTTTSSLFTTRLNTRSAYRETTPVHHLKGQDGAIFLCLRYRQTENLRFSNLRRDAWDYIHFIFRWHETAFPTTGGDLACAAGGAWDLHAKWMPRMDRRTPSFRLL